MENEVLIKMAAQAAWEEIQEAFSLLYGSGHLELDEPTRKAKAEVHMRKCNEWLYAIKR